MKELLPCPFCGGKPSSYESSIDTGAGDSVYVYRIICECLANPVVFVEGSHGYKQEGDIPNDEAKQKAIKAWNTRFDIKCAHPDCNCAIKCNE